MRVRVTEKKSLDSSYRSAGCRSIVPGGKVFEHHYRLVEIITDYLAQTHTPYLTKKAHQCFNLFLLLGALAHVFGCVCLEQIFQTEFSEIFNLKDVNQSI